MYDVEKEEELHSIYSDQTGRFPKKSSKGNQYIMVLVHIDSGAILVAPMKDWTSGEMIRAYQSLLNRLNTRGIRPKHHVLDNECSEDFKETIKKNHMTYQLVPPHDHRRNIAEKGIQTFKAHFIAILCGSDKDFPLHLWCQLLPQVEHTLNLLRPARTCPTVSAHAYLWGPHGALTAITPIHLRLLGARSKLTFTPESVRRGLHTQQAAITLATPTNTTDATRFTSRQRGATESATLYSLNTSISQCRR